MAKSDLIQTDTTHTAMEAADERTATIECKKHVRWGSVSVLEFRIGYNASTVPESGGPPVGLLGRPIRHSYLELSIDDDMARERNNVESALVTTMPPSSSNNRRCRTELWLDPMARVRIVAEQHALSEDDIALICQDVRVTLDWRALSCMDEVTEKTLGVLRVPLNSRHFRCSAVCNTTRSKVLLY
ncbi:hypothetical protein CCR75_006385 [Bremia lactucae]|uniref:Uncharacterized protein n=1 Tax=Bremia lactucae TaxID=4779 RepID=A0A976FNA5_BRELC|nr:hypothetical protein CCR75_006385 [Bremia lactucae]